MPRYKEKISVHCQNWSECPIHTKRLAQQQEEKNEGRRKSVFGCWLARQEYNIGNNAGERENRYTQIFLALKKRAPCTFIRNQSGGEQIVYEIPKLEDIDETNKDNSFNYRLPGIK